MGMKQSQSPASQGGHSANISTMADLNLSIPPQYRASLRVGTCSWKCEGWKGLIYRAGVKYTAGDYLVDYAKYFNTVEVDQWFWSLFPARVKLTDPRAAKEYAQSVPDDFVFRAECSEGDHADAPFRQAAGQPQG